VSEQTYATLTTSSKINSGQNILVITSLSSALGRPTVVQ